MKGERIMLLLPLLRLPLLSSLLLLLNLLQWAQLETA